LSFLAQTYPFKVLSDRFPYHSAVRLYGTSDSKVKGKSCCGLPEVRLVGLLSLANAELARTLNLFGEVRK
jgi:hypothetical protein